MCAALKNLLNFTTPDLTDFAPIKFLVDVAPFKKLYKCSEKKNPPPTLCLTFCISLDIAPKEPLVFVVFVI